MVSIEDIKQLRDETGVSPTEIKKALEQAEGNHEKAKQLLKAWGQKVLSKKVSRETKAGLIEAYTHPDSRMAVLLDIRCESDFVAKSPEFKNLSHEICLQVAAMKPLYVKGEEIPEHVLEEQKKKYEGEVKASGKPSNLVAQIIEGKVKKYKEEICLMDQLWIKDDSKNIKNVIEDTVAKVGENIDIKRFVRFEI